MTAGRSPFPFYTSEIAFTATAAIRTPLDLSRSAWLSFCTSGFQPPPTHHETKPGNAMSVKFIIVSAPRTGSTLLASTLNSVPGVCCHGELLLPNRVRGFRDGFDPLAATTDEREARAQALLQQRENDAPGFVRAALTGPGSAMGMKVIYQDLLHPRWRDVLESLLNDASVRWIHLQRRNPLRRYVSEQVMLAGGAIHSGMGGKAASKVRIAIDINDFQARSDQVMAESKQVDALLAERTAMRVFYEDLSADPGTTVAKLCEVLGIDVSPGHIKPALEKVGAEDLSASVSNYAELLRHETTRHWAQTN
jgi:LPS sulfotransferase NodH